MLHGLYVGPLTHLQGKAALLRPLERTQVLAQFDDTRATLEPALLDAEPNLIWAMSLGYGWHEFPAAHFKLSPNNCLAVQYTDSMSCRRCELSWHTNDPSPPACRSDVQREYTLAQWWDDLGSPHGNR